MISNVENPRVAAPEKESWPEISFSRRGHMIFMDCGRKAAFDLNNPYHRKHWDVLMALAREEFVGEPVLSAELKSYLNQDRPQGSEILHIAASIKFLGEE